MNKFTYVTEEFLGEARKDIEDYAKELSDEITMYQKSVDANTKQLINQESFFDVIKVGSRFDIATPSGARVTVTLGMNKSIIEEELRNAGVDEKLIKEIWLTYAGVVCNAVKHRAKVDKKV